MNKAASLLLFCTLSLGAGASEKTVALAPVAPVRAAANDASAPVLKDAVKESLKLTLKAQSSSAGDEVLLSEVIDASAIQGEAPAWLNTPVCKAAVAGGTRSVYQQEILNALRRQGVSEAISFTGANETKVTAQSQAIQMQDVMDLVRDSVRAAFEQDSDLETQVEFTNAQQLNPVRPGHTELSVEVPEAGLRPGVQMVRVRVSQSGRRVAETPVSIRVRVTGTVTVAAERIPANAVLEETSIKTLRKELTANEMNLRGELSELIGLRAKQSISAGQILQRRMLAQPLVIKRGDAVSVIVRRGALELTAMGEARADAALNESVRVLLQDNGAEVIGRASGSREVCLDQPGKNNR
jgi:flagella basal body P-ring formation protein FlgA